MVPERTDQDGAAVSRAAREFWSQAVGRPDHDGDRRAGPGPGPAGDAGLAPDHSRLPGSYGARCRRATSSRSMASRSRARRWDTSARDEKHIYIYSPSSAVRDKAVIRRGVARLEALGYDVELDEAVFATHMRFAGDDETRLAAIHRAADSGADIALITRGGYGLTRLLPRHPLQGSGQGDRQGHALRRLERLHRFPECRARANRCGDLVGPGPRRGFRRRRASPTTSCRLASRIWRAGRGRGPAGSCRGWRAPASSHGAQGRAVGRQPGCPHDAGGHAVDAQDQERHPVSGGRARAPVPRRADADAAAVRGRARPQKAILLGHFTNYKPCPA